MVNKAPKPTKAPKVPKAQKRAIRNQNDTMFGEGSLFARSQQFVKENDAKPFRDFGYVVMALLSFFIWRLAAAIQSQHQVFRYKPEDPKFFPKTVAATFLNVFWAAIAVKYFL
ncbi:hypothetical protein BG004_004531 [Podila humilis]|nr:hypothetical protein BG004_004531 [Podila humilis]